MQIYIFKPSFDNILNKYMQIFVGLADNYLWLQFKEVDSIHPAKFKLK